MVVDIESCIQRIGRELLTETRSRRRWWRRLVQQDIMLEKMMGHDAMRVAALRFVDVLPTLDDDADLTRHLHEYFGDRNLTLPFPALAHWGLEHMRSGVGAHVIAPIVRGLAGRMAHRFIAGDNARTIEQSLGRLWKRGMGFTLDLLGEAVVSQREAEQYQQAYLNMLRDLGPFVARWQPHARLDSKCGRRDPRLNLSVKLTALYSQFNPLDPDGTAAAVKDRLRPILTEARKLGAFVTVDMEDFDTKDVTLKIFREILMEPEFIDWPDAGLAMQAYLRCTIEDVAAMIQWAKQRPAPVTVRLVRGAYWDYETVIARQQRWPIPVWTDKAATDVNYETCLDMLMGAHPHIETAAGTHNVRSLALVMALAERYGLSPDQYEVQMLYGMADEIKARLVEMDQRLRVYVPFGELIPGMAYLVRRLLENTASQSFARLGAGTEIDVGQVLKKPEPKDDSMDITPPPPDGFVNEPPHRFTDGAEREAFAAAIESVRGQLGAYYPLIIGGREHRTPRELRSIDASDPKRVIGTTADAGPGDADLAVDAAEHAFAAWRHTPVAQRTAILRKAAALMRQRRDTLAAWEVFEANKPWREADADVTEAIDFVEYYAGQAERLDAGHAFDVPGETNRYLYEPRGVGAVIAPWNFPLAIAVGMSIGPIAVGNTVVLKPAPQTPIIAAQFVKLMHEAGLPAGVLNYLPGDDEAGKALVAHRSVSFVNFTGSLAAGCAIMQRAAQLDDGQHHLKHVVAELGGKNAIVIDSDADLDDAVKGVIQSAFGFAGQKCSAASRVIVVGDHYDAFVQRLVEAAGSLKIGPATDPATKLPPVIDAEAHRRIRGVIEEAKKYARCVLDPDPPQVSQLGEGYWIGPTIFAEVDPQSDLAQQEVFGPVLAVMKADDFDEAIRLANGVRYALTGGVYSRSPAHLEQAARQFRVGNLYLNRNITGAIVNRQPFGGFKLSGTDAKAGGPDYLMQFVQARTVTENTLRRGFAPDQDV